MTQILSQITIFILGFSFFIYLPHLIKQSSYVSEHALLTENFETDFEKTHFTDAELYSTQLWEIAHNESNLRNISIPFLSAINMNKQNCLDFIERSFKSLELETFRQSFTFPCVSLSTEKAVCEGSVISSIVRAKHGDGKEGIAITSELNFEPVVFEIENDPILKTSVEGVSASLALAKFFSNQKYLAKDLIFAISDGNPEAIRLWVEDYVGHNPRAGQLQAAFGLSFNRAPSNLFKSFSVVPSSLGGRLPNMDLVNSAIFSSRYYTSSFEIGNTEPLMNKNFFKLLDERFKEDSEQQRNCRNDYWRLEDYYRKESSIGKEECHPNITAKTIPKMSFSGYSQHPLPFSITKVIGWLGNLPFLDAHQKKLLTFVAESASEIPSGSHAFFNIHRIDSISLKAIQNFDNPSENTENLFRYMKTVISTIKTVNNLLERFHQSYFFYLLVGTNQFISIANYFIPFGIMMIAIGLPVLKLAMTKNGLSFLLLSSIPCIIFIATTTLTYFMGKYLLIAYGLSSVTVIPSFFIHNFFLP
eukprot:TRINITY_DN1411_c0_g1_i2.p1 TRINITY_DN1411_c0_g1~~TRINITY_DN1411_c0_g1_i2.p1  ORF type:complete len:531 (-),score=107.00 TRINITY_DN1411_c0_g1_i2:1403-2995(-)